MKAIFALELQFGIAIIRHFTASRVVVVFDCVQSCVVVFKVSGQVQVVSSISNEPQVFLYKAIFVGFSVGQVGVVCSAKASGSDVLRKFSSDRRCLGSASILNIVLMLVLSISLQIQSIPNLLAARTWSKLIIFRILLWKLSISDLARSEQEHKIGALQMKWLRLEFYRCLIEF